MQHLAFGRRHRRPSGSGHIGNSGIIAVSDQGFVYVSRREEGDVLLLKGENGDGKADKTPVQVVSRAQAHGLASKDNNLYLVTVKEVFFTTSAR